jgi:Anti-sigma-K factor rskA
MTNDDAVHTDPETLAMIAMGESVGLPSDAEHLASCDECGHELAQLRDAVAVGRSSLGAGPLLEVPAGVWRGISDELGLGAVAPVTPIDFASGAGRSESKRRMRGRGWIAGLVAASVVLVAAIGGGIVLSNQSRPTVLAQATLNAFPKWPSATGDATLEKLSGGERAVIVSLDAPKASDSYREVWLINKDATGLVSLGLLDGSNGRFVIPADIDLTEFTQVDISDEPLNGDPSHSGNSIVRGTLRAESSRALS